MISLQGVYEHDGKRGDGDEDGHRADAVEHQEPKGVPVHFWLILLSGFRVYDLG